MDINTLVEERRELWLTLAPLWLDREPGERDYARMVGVIQRSGLTFKQLEWIFRLELAPVLSRHQMSVAGEWRAFNEERLLRQLVAHNRRLIGWRRQCWALFSGLTTMMTRHRWQELMMRVQLAQDEAALDAERAD
ncbi:DUF7079 family protein [Halomonas sp. 328]|uniref:DUF7079 family protein n=1 Tax=Halomonas sp. 328 TaxID=2776704 RepID=UPI0018A7A9AB|nr:hypothetical protein [Halomonas sp. 328]MBF8222766.1 hypothetical protein [Halomonas sp. 328]